MADKTRSDGVLIDELLGTQLKQRWDKWSPILSSRIASSNPGEDFTVDRSAIKILAASYDRLVSDKRACEIWPDPVSI